jgi:electron transfer flavoprotein alpha subunit
MSGALVIVELANDKPATASLEHLSVARRLGLAGPVVALVFGAAPSVAAQLLARGADQVYIGTAPEYADYNSDIWVECALRVALETGVSLVMAAQSPCGADLAPCLAFRLQAGCATGCVSIENNNGALHFTRPCYGGNVRETLRFTTAVAVATLRAGTCDALSADAARTGEIIDLGTPPATRIRRLERRREPAGAQRLEDARVIVAGGRGLNGPDGFKVLEPLADLLGGAVGASRVPCDLGWCSHAMQIGLTGKTVTPALYIAVGISGASHHLAGCGNAKTIVAINTDAEAAIFRDAKFGVVGDFAKVVPALTAAVRALPPLT